MRAVEAIHGQLPRYTWTTSSLYMDNFLVLLDKLTQCQLKDIILALLDTQRCMSQNKDIVKSNALIEAAYSPGNVYKMRVLLACLMQVKSKDELSHTKNFIITANALADLTGSKAKNNYEELKTAAAGLRAMYITVMEKPNGEGGSPVKTEINVTGSCRYYDSEGKVSLRFNAEIIPYISSLKNRFTKYQAKYVMPMRSGYGIRLYELCLQWLGEEREFSVGEFRAMFDLENKYPVIADLRKRVIIPALRDINEHSDIRARFGQRKAGRRISHFQFMIAKPQTKTASLSHRDWIDKYKMGRPGQSWEETIKRTQSEYNKYKNVRS